MATLGTALRSRLETRANVRGTWAALQAMARLAHAGCEIGDLRVAAFNGRLFAPAHAPLLDHLRLDDRAVSAALALIGHLDAAVYAKLEALGARLEKGFV